MALQVQLADGSGGRIGVITGVAMPKSQFFLGTPLCIKFPSIRQSIPALSLFIFMLGADTSSTAITVMIQKAQSAARRTVIGDFNHFNF